MKQKSLKALKKEADKHFSEYIRSRDRYICFTCGKKLTKQTSQCGHYISRNYLSLRYNHNNCHCQCIGCNIFKKGNLTQYALNLQRKYGSEILEILDENKRVQAKFTRQNYQDMIELFKTLKSSLSI